LKDDHSENKDIEIKENFNTFKSDLQLIKNQYDNKRKTLQKRQNEEKEEEKSAEPVKKKKTTHKKNGEKLDASEIIKNFSKNEDKEENQSHVENLECKTPIKESCKEEMEINSPTNSHLSDVKIKKPLKLDSAPNKILQNNSAKKLKPEIVSIIIIKNYFSVFEF
jgi:hypothetical protein